MSNTLRVTLNHSESGFTFDLSYTDDEGTKWTGVVFDGGTLAFSCDGHCELSAGGRRKLHHFTDLQVVLGERLGRSQACDTGGSFDVSDICFPHLDRRTGDETVQAHTWCQEVATGEVLDPKLGLTNTTSNTGNPVVGFPNCRCGSGHE